MIRWWEGVVRFEKEDEMMNMDLCDGCVLSWDWKGEIDDEKRIYYTFLSNLSDTKVLSFAVCCCIFVRQSQHLQ